MTRPREEERGIKRFLISEEMIEELIRTDTAWMPAFPDDVKVERIHTVPEARGIEIYVSSDEYPVVVEGEVIPSGTAVVATYDWRDNPEMTLDMGRELYIE